MGHWVQARNYAERAKAHYEQINDERNVGRLLNNLGGLNFHARQARAGGRASAGRVPRAARQGQRRGGRECRRITRPRASDDGRGDRGRGGSPSRASPHGEPRRLPLPRRSDAARAGSSADGTGRLDEAEEFLAASDASAEQLESISHQAAAWMARGDLAAKRGEDGAAASSTAGRLKHSRTSGSNDERR